jgi:hypothetical protein
MASYKHCAAPFQQHPPVEQSKDMLNCMEERRQEQLQCATSVKWDGMHAQAAAIAQHRYVVIIQAGITEVCLQR